MIDPLSDEHFMKKALLEAELALQKGEVPVGVVVVAHGQIIARGHNLTETLTDVTAHAEMQAITSAANYLGAKYLKTFEYIYLQFQFLMVIAKSRTFISLTKLCPQTLGNMLRCVSRMWQTGQSNVIAQFRVKLYSVSTLIVF